MARGIGLIIVAVVLGVVLLKATDSPEPFREEATAGESATNGDDGGEAVDDGGEAGDDSTTTTVAQARNPAEVTILVANGSGVSGAAGRVAETLKGANYAMKDSTNTTSPAESSFVYFTPGYEADAAAVAARLAPATPAVQAMPDPVPVRDLAGANILVVVAADLAAG
jgi:hypothetical protein